MPRVEWSFLMRPEDHRNVKRFLRIYEYTLTPWGKILFVALIISVSLSSVGTQISAFLMASFVLAYALTAWFLSFFFKPKVKAYRKLPSTPTAGNKCHYKVVVKNTGKAPLRQFSIYEQALPYGLYADYLNPNYNNHADWIYPGEITTLDLIYRIPRRGSFELPPLIAASSYPSGILRATRKIGLKDRLIVYPRKAYDKNIYDDITQGVKTEGQSLTFKSGTSNEFLNTREYRHGDRLRDIHWASSAKKGELITKEYIKEHYLHIGLFVDTELKRYEKHKYFEGRISLCAGTAQKLYENHFIIDCFTSNPEYTHIQIGQQTRPLEHLLEYLAMLLGERKVDFNASLKAIEEHAHQMNYMVIFLKDWDRQRQTFVKSINKMGITVKCIIIRDKPTALQTPENIQVIQTKELRFNDD